MGAGEATAGFAPDVVPAPTSIKRKHPPRDIAPYCIALR